MSEPTPARMTDLRQVSRWLLAGIFLCFLAVYLITMSRERTWGDATPVYKVAENLVRDGELATGIRFPPETRPGRNGKFYAYNPLLTSLIHVPGVLLREALTELWPATQGLSIAWACHLGPAALGALTCVLLFLICLRTGASVLAASLTTVTVGLGTTLWVYAHYTYTEAVQTACYTGLVLASLAAHQDPRRSRFLAVGLWAGLLLNTKTVYVLAFPGAAAVILWRLRNDRRAMLQAALWGAAGLLPFVALTLFYNWFRFGSPFDSGYNEGVGRLFAQASILHGLWGLLLSPGKSVFLYSPPLVLALWGWRHLRGKAPAAVTLFLVTAIPVVLLNARTAFWHGDFAWGPRYLVFAIPVFCVPLAALFDHWRSRRWLLTLTLTGTLAAGVFVQILGLAFYWDHYIRLAREARMRWLGQANLSGALLPERGGICDACFEDLHGLHWLPPFQPIRGHFWFLRHVPFGHDWRQAEKDAPWKAHTSLELNIAVSYPWARLDWWVLDYRPHKTVAGSVMAGLTLMLAGGILLWVRGARAQRSARRSSSSA